MGFNEVSERQKLHDSTFKRISLSAKIKDSDWHTQQSEVFKTSRVLPYGSTAGWQSLTMSSDV